MDQEGYKLDQKGLTYIKKGFWTKNTCFLDKNYLIFAEFWVPFPLNRNWCA